MGFDRIRRPLANAAAIEIDAAHAGLRCEGNEGGMGGGEFAATDIEFLFGQHHNAAAFGCFIGQGGKLRGIGELLLGDTGSRAKIRRHAIADGDGAGFVEQEYINVSCGLNGATTGGHDVATDKAVNAADADGAEQSADGGGNQAHEQGDEHRRGEFNARINAKGTQRDAHQQEDERHG